MASNDAKYAEVLFCQEQLRQIRSNKLEDDRFVCRLLRKYNLSGNVYLLQVTDVTGISTK